MGIAFLETGQKNKVVLELCCKETRPTKAFGKIITLCNGPGLTNIERLFL